VPHASKPSLPVERLAVEVVPDPIVNRELPDSCFNLAFSIQDEQLAGVKVNRVRAAVQRIGWTLKRTRGPHALLAREDGLITAGLSRSLSDFSV
jgi:hypothetical protein